VTSCPYKGTASGRWSSVSEVAAPEYIAWVYYFPIAGAGSVAGLVAFCNVCVDLYVDGMPLPRPAGPA
jgi:uncharacterized protein (DUF427 family)